MHTFGSVTTPGIFVQHLSILQGSWPSAQKGSLSLAHGAITRDSRPFISWPYRAVSNPSPCAAPSR